LYSILSLINHVSRVLYSQGKHERRRVSSGDCVWAVRQDPNCSDLRGAFHPTKQACLISSACQSRAMRQALCTKAHTRATANSNTVERRSCHSLEKTILFFILLLLGTNHPLLSRTRQQFNRLLWRKIKHLQLVWEQNDDSLISACKRDCSGNNSFCEQIRSVTHLWFNENIGLQEFIQKKANMTYLSFGKLEYTMTHHVADAPDYGLGIKQFGFTAGSYCRPPFKCGCLKFGDPWCPVNRGRSKVMVPPCLLP
jgi:hypothetical protein